MKSRTFLHGPISEVIIIYNVNLLVPGLNLNLHFIREGITNVFNLKRNYQLRLFYRCINQHKKVRRGSKNGGVVVTCIRVCPCDSESVLKEREIFFKKV